MIFLLYGEDIFRSKEKLGQLKRIFLEKNPSSVIDVFDFSEKKHMPEPVMENFSSSGLFSQKKMVVIENMLRELSAENQKDFLTRFKSLPTLKDNPDIVVIFREDGQPKKNLSLWKYLDSNSKGQHFILLDPKGLEKWTVDWLKENFPSVSFQAKPLSIFVSCVGSDLFLLRNELEKLANYRLSGEITEDYIDLLVNSQTRSTVFQATEALLGGKRSEALRLFHEQIEKGEDLFYLLSMYIYQVRTLLRISSALERGNSVPANIAKETGLHPYVVQKSIFQARLAGLTKLKDMFVRLQKIDFLVKTGRTDLKMALDRLIAES